MGENDFTLVEDNKWALLAIIDKDCLMALYLKKFLTNCLELYTVQMEDGLEDGKDLRKHLDEFNWITLAILNKHC